MPSVYLFDTNTVSAVMADHPKVRTRLSTQQGTITTCAVVQGEIRYGLERLPLGKRRTNLEFKARAVFASLSVEPVTALTGEICGTMRRELELKGYTISDNDQWIAATALSLGSILVSNDRIFGYVPGLSVEDWMS